MNSNVITIAKFLKMFLQVEDYALTKLTHSDLKILIPELERCSFEYADEHIAEVMRGDIIMVIDAKNNVVPYLAPDIKMTDELKKPYIEETKERKDKEVVFQELSNYELRQLLNSSKNGYHISNQAKKELDNRGAGKQKSKVKDYKRRYKLSEEE